MLHRAGGFGCTGVEIMKRLLSVFVATAALLAGKVRVPAGARVVAIVSGGNVDLSRFPRGERAADRIAR